MAAGDMTVEPSSKGQILYERLLVVLFAVALGYAAYFVLRYGGLWTENDTSVFSTVTMQMLRAGTVLFPGQYTHGYGYPAWLGSITLLTGLRVGVVNTIIMPYLGSVFLALLAFLTYRVWVRSGRWAILAVLLLFGSPDLLFGALRGNHEKLSIALFLMVFYAMGQGFSAIGSGKLRQYAVWTFLMYLFVFTNATVNDYFASTLAVATTVAVVVAIWMTRRSKATNERDWLVVRRFSAVMGTAWLLVLWVMFFVFTPAGADFRLLKGAAGKLVSLFLTFHTGSNPYTLAHQQWAGPVVIDLVASYRWAIFIASFGAWLAALWWAVVRRNSLVWENLILVTLYGAFGLTVAVAIPLDFVGLAAGSNLEVRNFTYFVLFASPMLLLGIRALMRRRGDVAKFVASSGVKSGASVFLAGFIAIGLLKATLDPSISNQWMFYRPSERQAVTYFWNRAENSTLWTGPDNRIVYMWGTWNVADPNHNSVLGYTLTGEDRDWLRSQVVVASTVAEGAPVPDYAAQNLVYNDGFSQIYHMVPQTPFQN